ncbi:MAG: phosphotransferase [bacterium]|nr:phosphotransferase [bacterium]
MENGGRSRDRAQEPGFFPAAFRALPEGIRLPENPGVIRLPGDASNRSYYRVSGAGAKSLILMVLADADPHRQPAEEITAGEKPRDEIPFLNLQRYLEKLGLPVPRVVYHDLKRGIIYLEDLGDTLLYDLALPAGPRAELSLYHQALELLVELQLRAERRPDPDCLAFHRRFDAGLFEWEFQHFREELLPSGLPEAPELERGFRKLARELAEERGYFCHRDYHSRNLLVQDGGIKIIDFQDALLALRQYDLASLLFDAYVDFTPDLVEELLDYYLSAWEKAGGKPDGREPFRRMFYLAGVQRGLKAAGRFAYIKRVKDNPKFLPFIPGVLRRIRPRFALFPELAGLEKIIDRELKIDK